MKEKIICFVKKEMVLCIAWLLAIASMFVITPSLNYIKYIDFRTLALLFSLMAIIEGMQSIGVFHRLADLMLSRVRNTRQVVLVLVLLCFITAMFITNDVALITFVPFTIMILKMTKQEKDMIYVIALQTIATNLGSMLTPIGNPQNLYLYSHYELGLGEFVAITAPITLLALILVILATNRIGKKPITFKATDAKNRIDYPRFLAYFGLFLLAIATVLHIIPYYITLLLVLIGIVIINYRILMKVDYSLLFTFIAFFILVGNIGEIESVRLFLRSAVEGHELMSSILLAQGISNVPTALLLSNFTNNYKELIFGVNLGGLGTLIASMASLISYKLYCKQFDARPKKYLLVFTGLNLIALVVLTVFTFIINA